MAEHTRLSEVDGGPFLETNLILHSKLKAAAHKYPDDLAVISCHQQPDFSKLNSESNPDPGYSLRWTFRELWKRSEDFAKALIEHGIPTDKRIAVFLRNQAEWPLAFWSSLILGAGFVAMHPVLTDSPVELEHQLAIAQPGTILAADIETADALEKLVPQFMNEAGLKIVASGNKNKNGWTSLHEILQTDVSSMVLPKVERTPNDVCTLYFTSGTTSLPKAAPCKSANTVRAMTGYGNSWCIDISRRIVAHSPSFHSYTGTAWFGFWLFGGCVVYPSPSYSPAATLQAIEKEACTDMMGNPSMIESLVNHPEAQTRSLSSLFHVNLSGSVVHPEYLRMCAAPPLNANVVASSFGVSETATLSNWNIHDRQPKYIDAVSVGKLVPGAKARVCFPNTRQLVPWGEIGELHIGNPFIYQGWPGRDESNFYDEGDTVWVVTGDQARVGDQEELYILGRYKDLIIRGGRNISPAAIEAVINVLPGTSSMAIGLPDDVAGEVPAVVVKYSDGIERTDKEIKEVVTNAIGQYASPQRIIRLHDLALAQFPVNPAGKLDRKRIASRVKAHCGSANRSSLAESAVENTPEATTCASLVAVWAELSAQSVENMSVDQPVTGFGDSLLLLQVISLIKKRLKHNITIEEVISHPTIRQQAKLLSTRSSVSAESFGGQQRKRAGPPSASDMAHVRHDEAAYSKTKVIVEQALSKYGLGWAEVEDILPCCDNGRFMLSSARRLQSWNDRHVFVVNGDAKEVREALSESLRHHPLFRSIAVKDDKETWLHVVLRHQPESIKHTVSLVQETTPVTELPFYRLNDPQFDHASPDGFLFNATVIPTGDNKSSGVVINMNHSVYDAISTSLWLEDFALCLGGKASEVQSRVPYKHFADAYYYGRHCSAARKSTNFFLRNLLWYVTEKNALWPKQYQPGWFMGDVVGPSNDHDRSTRKCVDPDEERCGSVGFAAEVKITDELQSRSGISAVAIFKAAVAIFNVHQTKAKHAIFSSWEAARSFPFLEENPAYASLLPNPMDIAGPTGQRVVNRIPVSPECTVLDLLLETQAEIPEISKHAHAPLYEIRDRLADISETEADAFVDALHRQIFNWIPNLWTTRGLNSQDRSESAVLTSSLALRRVQRIARGDCGFAWTGCRSSKHTVNLSCWWDDAQLGWREAKAALAEVVACVKWMMQQENLDKHVSQWWEEDCDRLSKDAAAVVVLADTT